MSLHECPHCVCGEDEIDEIKFEKRLEHARWFGKARLSRVDLRESTHWKITRNGKILKQSHYHAPIQFSGVLKNDMKMVKLAKKLGR